MDIKVLNRQKIKAYHCDMPHIVISITENKDFVELPTNVMRKGLLQLSFGDIDVPSQGITLFNQEIAKKIIKFVEDNIDFIDVIFCQCEAGISRSAAVGAALSKYINGNDDYFFKYHMPNRHVYNLLLNELMCK